MGEIKGFEDLKVWQKSHELVLEVYKVTQEFPNQEKFGLTSQIRRSAVSVAANIAEGSMRQHLNEYIQHVIYRSRLVIRDKIVSHASKRPEISK
jgi:hypothetical protein